jgi:hypothetical protein
MCGRWAILKEKEAGSRMVEGMTFEKRLGESFEKMGKSLYAKVLKKAFK